MPPDPGHHSSVFKGDHPSIDLGQNIRIVRRDNDGCPSCIDRLEQLDDFAR